VKREFDTIQLIDRIENWKKIHENNTYVALTDDASIFVYFETANYKLLKFKKDQFFQIDDDFIIYDNQLLEKGSSNVSQ